MLSVILDFDWDTDVSPPWIADVAVPVMVLVSVFIGLLTAVWFATRVALIHVPPPGSALTSDPKATLLAHKHEQKNESEEEYHMDIGTIQKAVADGANAFLFQEY